MKMINSRSCCPETLSLRVPFIGDPADSLSLTAWPH
jgi:hypothetical protein